VIHTTKTAVVDKPQAEEHDENDLLAAPNRAEGDSAAPGAPRHRPYGTIHCESCCL